MSASPTHSDQAVGENLRPPSDASSPEYQDRLARIAQAYSTILELAGEDLSRDGILKTPVRAAKAILDMTNGYEQSLFEIVNDAIFIEDCNELVIVRDIDFHSLCEHHMLPFSGKIHVGYVPNGRVLGLSKFARIAELYARRFQVQERLTKQICQAVDDVMTPMGVGVVIEAEHSCMSCRGVQKHATTFTSSFSGIFHSDPAMKHEFLSLVGKPISRHR